MFQRRKQLYFTAHKKLKFYQWAEWLGFDSSRRNHSSLWHHIQIGLWAQPSSYPVGIVDYFLRGKVSRMYSWPFGLILCCSMELYLHAPLCIHGAIWARGQPTFYWYVMISICEDNLIYFPDFWNVWEILNFDSNLLLESYCFKSELFVVCHVEFLSVKLIIHQ